MEEQNNRDAGPTNKESDYPASSNNLFGEPFAAPPRKSKFLAGLFSFFIPGTGHFYLGLMQKGILIMLLFIVDIAAIPFTVMNAHGNAYIPFIVLLSCLIPVIYFYSLFDALQSADRVNAYYQALQYGQVPSYPPHADPFSRTIRGHTFGVILIIVGVVLFLFSVKPSWLDELYNLKGSYIGAVLLIGAGILLFISETTKR